LTLGTGSPAQECNAFYWAVFSENESTYLKQFLCKAGETGV